MLKDGNAVGNEIIAVLEAHDAHWIEGDRYGPLRRGTHVTELVGVPPGYAPPSPAAITANAGKPTVTVTKVRCGKCLWVGHRKREPLKKPCPRCEGRVVEWRMPCVYLLCFRDSHGNHARYKHAGHYMGYSGDLIWRLLHHRNGTGANLVKVILGAGLNFVISRTWPGGDQTLERKLKNAGSHYKKCPLCKEGI